MLYGRNLGFKGNFANALHERDPLALELFHKMEEVKHDVAKWMKPRAVWQFIEAERAGNSIHLFSPGARRADCTRSASAAKQSRMDYA